MELVCLNDAQVPEFLATFPGLVVLRLGDGSRIRNLIGPFVGAFLKELNRNNGPKKGPFKQRKAHIILSHFFPLRLRESYVSQPLFSSLRYLGK